MRMTMIKFLLIGLPLVCLAFALEAKAQPSAAPGAKILVAYFSWSGNAKAIAEQIAAETGGDLFEIRSAEAYPDDYDDCTDLAKKEQRDGARPRLATAPPDLSPYGTVFLCYPNWWGTLPMPVFTFLEAAPLSDKTVYPVVTHGGSRFGRSLDDLKKLAPEAAIGEGLSVSAFDRNPGDGPKVRLPHGETSSWLRGLGLSK
jgi:flavodoxin